MSLSNKTVHIDSAKNHKGLGERVSSKEALELTIKRHDSLLDLATYHNDVLEDFSPYVMNIMKAENVVNKSLSAFLYLCANDKQQALEDFKRLRLSELDIRIGDLFQEIAYSFEGYKKIGALKLRVADFTGELHSTEVKDVRKLMQTHQIGTHFKQQTINRIREKSPPDNVTSLF